MASSPLSAAGFQPAEEGRRRGFVSLILLFLLPAAIFSGLVAYGHFKPTRAATPHQGTPGSLVWGDGKVIFSNKQQLAAWLRLHGSSYSAFVKHHPEALRLVTAHPPKHVAAKVAADPTKAVKAKAHATATPRPTVTVATHQAAPRPAATGKPGGGSIPVSSRTLVFSVSAALGLLLGLFALLPAPLLRRFGLRTASERQRELRLSAVAVSLAFLVGVGVAVLMG